MPARRHPVPKIVAHCVERVAARLASDEGGRRPEGHHVRRAFAICTAASQKRGHLRPGTRSLTAAGRRAESAHMGETGRSRVYLPTWAVNERSAPRFIAGVMRPSVDSRQLRPVPGRTA